MVDTAFTEIIKIRFKRPLEALKDDAVIKTLLSIAAFILSYITDIIHTLGDIFNTPAELVLLLIFAIIADFVTGVMAAKKRGEYIRSLGFRQTAAKVIIYGMFLIALAGLANVMGANKLEGWVGEVLRYLRNIHWLGYFYCIFSELKSAFIENIGKRNSAIGKIIERIDRKIFNKMDKEDKL